MASLPTELKDTLLCLSDPNLNLISEPSTSLLDVSLVEGKENTSRGVDFLEPKVYVGTTGSSFGWWAENDGIMDGVGGSDSTLDVEETGKVKPRPLSEETMRLGSGLLMEMLFRVGLVLTGGLSRPERGPLGAALVARS